MVKTSSRPEEQVPPTDQKCGKPDRGVKRGIKSKQVESTESAGIKVSETRAGSKGDQTPEPTAKKAVRPSKSTKEPTVPFGPAGEHQPKPIVNGKPVTSREPSSVSSTAQEGKPEPQVKACQGSQKEKEMEKKTHSQTQVCCNTTLSEMFLFFLSINQFHLNKCVII